MVYHTRVFWALITLLLIGCNISEAVEPHGNDDSSSLSDKTYEIVTAEYHSGDIVIRYPQIVNLSDSGKQNEINKIIKEEALTVLNDYDEIEITSELSMNINFDVMWQGQRLLSIRYLGGGYLKGAANTFDCLYTTNINLIKGTKIKLKELVMIDEAFLSDFKQAKYKPWHPALDLEEGGIIDEVLSTSYNDNRLMEAFNKTDLSDRSWAFWYLTEDSLGISIGISDLGNHLEFEIDYEDLRSNTIDNELWKDFSSKL